MTPLPSSARPPIHWQRRLIGETPSRSPSILGKTQRLMVQKSHSQPPFGWFFNLVNNRANWLAGFQPSTALVVFVGFLLTAFLCLRFMSELIDLVFGWSSHGELVFFPRGGVFGLRIYNKKCDLCKNH